jgi:hypothetical protein
MSPQLAKENFFVLILNQIKNEEAQTKEETQLQELLLEIGGALLQEGTINELLIKKINQALQQRHYFDLCVQFNTGELVVTSQFSPSLSRFDRNYIEAIVSVVEALEKGPIEIKRCEQCNEWFLPYKRAKVSKFCSKKCRNRANYLINKEKINDHY